MVKFTFINDGIMKSYVLLILVLVANTLFAQKQMETSAALTLLPSEISSDATLQNPIEKSPVLFTMRADDYRVSMPPGVRMRNIGRSLTLGGCALILGGALIYNSVENPTHYVVRNGQYYEEMDPKAALGILMIIGGTGMTVPGIIFWTKGAKKYKRHLEKTAAFQWNGNGARLIFLF